MPLTVPRLRRFSQSFMFCVIGGLASADVSLEYALILLLWLVGAQNRTATPRR